MENGNRNLKREGALELLLPPSSEYWDYRHTSPYLVCVVLRINPLSRILNPRILNAPPNLPWIPQQVNLSSTNNKFPHTILRS